VGCVTGTILGRSSFRRTAKELAVVFRLFVVLLFLLTAASCCCFGGSFDHDLTAGDIDTGLHPHSEGAGGGV
jgi:hypothetical protein